MFQRDNSRAAKVNGEMVLWIRKQYSAMISYPMIREGLRDNFGVLLSIQQITRIAKGYSFAHLAEAPPLDREVDLQMHLSALRGAPPASEQEVAASLARFQALLEKDNEPQQSVMDILENRARNIESHSVGDREAKRVIPSLEEIEARERAVMGIQEGSGLDKLLNTQVEMEAEKQDKPIGKIAQINADKLLETLK